ncbi:putative cytochrome P450 [Thozetella sp. PMI_491]|nr:putative cytochrome P450 [Thozetella sp. PMI_491]
MPSPNLQWATGQTDVWSHWASERSIALFSIIIGFLLYVAFLVIYRFALSPIAGFPGPKIAAATAWYEFYYDVIKPGQYYRKINELHDRYGPIVRINPWELTVRDGEFHSTLYVPGSVRRSQIFPRSRAGIGIDAGSHPVSEDHDLHRIRRKPLDPFFSRRSVQGYEYMIINELKRLESRLSGLRGSGTIINMEHVYAAVIGDLIGAVSLVEAPDLVLDERFSPDWHLTLCRFFKQITLYTHFTFLMGWIKLVPPKFLLRLYPGAAGFKAFTELITNHIEDAKKKGISDKHGLENSGRPSTLIQHLLASDMPESEKATSRLLGEFIAILSGGTMTTARALSTITYFVLANPSIATKLAASLEGPMSKYPETTPRWAELENIPYLRACIQEGLRISHGSMRRVPRVSPDVDIQYKEWTIRRGVPVGMSAYMMHTDSKVYPKPFEFIPERWLGEYDPVMNQHFIPFSKGSRNCLGMSLAYAEIYLAVAVIFRPGAPTLSLFETDETDVIPIHDYFLAMPKLETKGMRVKVV